MPLTALLPPLIHIRFEPQERRDAVHVPALARLYRRPPGGASASRMFSSDRQGGTGEQKWPPEAWPHFELQGFGHEEEPVDASAIFLSTAS